MARVAVTRLDTLILCMVRGSVAYSGAVSSLHTIAVAGVQLTDPEAA